MTISYTVIIPHYNSKGLIRRTLRSIPERNDIQIIVVDDLSTEKTIFSISKEEEFSHVEFVFLDKKAAPSGARNIALNKAIGEYILFADNDDYFSPDSFSIFDSYIKSKKEFYQFRTDSFLESTGEIGSGTRVKNYNKYYERADRIGLMLINHPWAKLLSRNFLEKYNIRFNEQLVVADDIYFSRQCACFTTDYLFCPEVVYYVSQGDQNATSSYNRDDYINLLSETIKSTKLITDTKAVPLFAYFKDVQHKLWFDLDIHINDHEYSTLLNEYKKELPLSVKLYWDWLNFFGQLKSPQLHFRSSSDEDICYVLQPGKKKDKLIVNFNDFGNLDKSASEAERFPYNFANTFRKSKIPVLDIRDFWGKTGAAYYYHKGKRIDSDINECILYTKSLLKIPFENIILFGYGKGANAALHFAGTFGYSKIIAAYPYSDFSQFLQIIKDMCGNNKQSDISLGEYFSSELSGKDLKLFLENGSFCNYGTGDIIETSKKLTFKQIVVQSKIMK